MRIVALFLQYDSEKYPNSLYYFRKYFEYLRGYEKQLIVIDNKIESDYIKHSDDFTVINGDNRLWEWTGWQRGIDYLKENNIDYDAIIFANDAFMAPGGVSDLYGIICNPENIMAAIEQGKMLGSECGYPVYGDYIIDGYKIETYKRTNCFVIPQKVIEKLKTIYHKDLDFYLSYIPKNPEFPYFADNAPLNGMMKRHLVDVFENRWHSSPGSIENYKELFRMKSYALINEFLLAERAKKCQKQ